MTRTLLALDDRRQVSFGFARVLALLLAVSALAACASRSINFNPDATASVAGFDAAQLERFDVYHQDNYGRGPSPSAVVLDVDDGVAFEGTGWWRAPGESAPRLVSQALGAGLLASELRDREGDLLGHLIGRERWYDRRRNRYRLAVADAGESYDVLTAKLTHEIGGGR